ncbi:hypothetical protein KP509_30G011700 [Ceratopteris richardii]|uniref:COBRA C-terminal domain-containing protein n=1 Tax=Ceratopteris richardii TaxID=49495 RepID=A0A8T2R1J9_CERRI|nr:hypothetical protein KP509_30G011700 [Ceratopteris richardii]
MNLFSSLTLILFLFPSIASGQSTSFDNVVSTCNDSVGILYTLQSLERSYPLEGNTADQAYAFTASLQIFNAGKEDLEGWQISIDYVHREILVDGGGALVADGSTFPYNASNGVNLTSAVVLKTGIETAMDTSQMGASYTIKGVEFGQNVTSLPTNITLLDVNYECSAPVTNVTLKTIRTCCKKINSTIMLSSSSYLPRYKGDVTILYDVLKASQNQYQAQVTLSNDSPTGRLDYWNLQWSWQNGEFIYSMRGATTLEQDQDSCIFGKGMVYYAGVDFSTVTSCQQRPTIIDLDQYKANDSTIGRLEYCCRNGTLLPAIQDPSKSKSVFQLIVYKLPPQNTNSTLISPPINWNLTGTFSSDYTCGQPRLVEPTLYVDDSISQRTESVVMSWQVTCNVTRTQVTPKCCVSFSAYNNQSVVPCKTCACSCASQSTCNRSAEALLIPVELATVPFVNRTQKTLAWAQLNNWAVPTVLPCPDNCGVSVNWHLVSDYTNGWSARMTIFNWQGLSFADWSAAVELSGSVFSGFQKAYSFNYTSPGNNTIFLYGLNQGLSYLNGIYDNYPGIQQSVLSFSLDAQNSNVSFRDFYPKKVFFDGNECALPDLLPSNDVGRLNLSLGTALVLALALYFGSLSIL